MIILLPLIGIISIILLIKIGRPIIFRQKRTGLCLKEFYFYKFRTMNLIKDAEGNLLSDEQRLISIGKILRNYSLDELPSLWNVLKNDMSLVGPRPLLPEYVGRYNEEQIKRHKVKPGITGWAQINGRNAISWEDKFKLDIWYFKNHSILLDFKILLLTISKVLKKDNINHDGHSTMPEFKGEKNK